MTDNRAAMLEFESGEEVRKPKARARQLIAYGAKVVDRCDVDAAIFTVSVSCLTFVVIVSRNQNAAAAFASAVIVMFTIPSIIYGTRVVGGIAPEAAAAMTQFAYNIRSVSRLDQRANSATAPPTRLPSVELSHEEKWRQGLRRFLTIGRLAGSFSIHKLAKDRISDRGEPIPKYLSEPGWKTFNALFRSWGILTTRRVEGRAQTWYADGWDYGRATFHLKHARLELPEGEPPEITL